MNNILNYRNRQHKQHKKMDQKKDSLRKKDNGF